jgi:hypothetical protein
MGSHPYEPRGNLSELLINNYITLTLLAQELSNLERITGLATGKKLKNVSVLSGNFGSKLRNSLRSLEIDLSASLCPDIGN